MDYKVNLSNIQGITHAEELITGLSVNQTIPVGNLVGAQRGINGAIRVQELAQRYREWVLKRNGQDKPDSNLSPNPFFEITGGTDQIEGGK